MNPPGRFGVLNTPVLVYRKTEKFTVIHITIKNQIVDDDTVPVPPYNNNYNLGRQHCPAITKTQSHEVHWNLELHQPHRVYDYMHCGYRIGH